MDEREHAVRGLSEDLQIAFASATLAFELRQMVHRHGPLVRLAEDFTWFALRAARDTAVIHLWKVYDTQKQARSLRWFLSRFSKAGPSDRDRDMQRISPSSADVNRLMRLRHQVFAHRGHEAAVKGSAAILESNDLTAPEVFELIQVARDILRQHYGAALPETVSSRSENAINQLRRLDIHLRDVIPTGYGYSLTTFEPETDE